MSRVPPEPSRQPPAHVATPALKASPARALDHADEWEEEIARRIEEVRSGKVKTIPLDQAMAEIRAELDRRR